MTPAEQLADAILTASGSGLKHYTSEYARAPILAAAQREIDKRESLIAACRAAEDAMCQATFNLRGRNCKDLNWAIEKVKAAIAAAKGERT